MAGREGQSAMRAGGVTAADRYGRGCAARADPTPASIRAGCDRVTSTADDAAAGGAVCAGAAAADCHTSLRLLQDANDLLFAEPLPLHPDSLPGVPYRQRH